MGSSSPSTSAGVLTCGHQHHGGEQSQLLHVQLQRCQFVAEVKHGSQQLAHPHRPQLLQAVGGAGDEGHRLFLHVEQGRKAHHQHLEEERRRSTRLDDRIGWSF